MSFYLTNDSGEETYITTSYLRQALIDNCPDIASSVTDNTDSTISGNSYVSTFLKRISFGETKITVSELVSLMKKYMTDENENIFSSLLAMEKSQFLTIAYLLSQGFINVDDIEELISMSYYNRTEACLAYLSREDYQVNIFISMYNSLDGYYNSSKNKNDTSYKKIAINNLKTEYTSLSGISSINFYFFQIWKAISGNTMKYANYPAQDIEWWQWPLITIATGAMLESLVIPIQDKLLLNLISRIISWIGFDNFEISDFWDIYMNRYYPDLIRKLYTYRDKLTYQNRYEDITKYVSISDDIQRSIGYIFNSKKEFNTNGKIHPIPDDNISSFMQFEEVFYNPILSSNSSYMNNLSTTWLDEDIDVTLENSIWKISSDSINRLLISSNMPIFSYLLVSSNNILNAKRAVLYQLPKFENCIWSLFNGSSYINNDSKQKNIEASKYMANYPYTKIDYMNQQTTSKSKLSSNIDEKIKILDALASNDVYFEDIYDSTSGNTVIGGKFVAGSLGSTSYRGYMIDSITNAFNLYDTANGTALSKTKVSSLLTTKDIKAYIETVRTALNTYIPTQSGTVKENLFMVYFLDIVNDYLDFLADDSSDNLTIITYTPKLSEDGMRFYRFLFEILNYFVYLPSINSNIKNNDDYNKIITIMRIMKVLCG